MTEIEKTIDKDGVVHFTNAKENQTLHVEIENKSEFDKELVWDELKLGIVNKLKEKGIDYSADLITNKEQLDNAGRVLSQLEEREKSESNLYKSAPTGGDTSWLMDDKEQNTIQLDENTDINNLEFSDETQLITALNTLSDKNNPTAKKLLGKLSKKVLESKKNCEYELQSPIKDVFKEYKIINEFDSEEKKRQKETFNNKLKKSRSNWVEV